MTKVSDSHDREAFPTGEPVNISRRRFLLGAAGTMAGALVLGFGLPVRQVRAQTPGNHAAPGTHVPAFLEIRPDNTIRLQSPFIEGGQGIFTGMAQIVGEELDAEPMSFIVENAPPDAEYTVMENGLRITGGSMSVRMSYSTMRRLGALARHMLLQAAASQLGVPLDTLTTEPGRVIHQGFRPVSALWATRAAGQLAPRATRAAGNGTAGARCCQRDAQGSEPVPLDRETGTTSGRLR
ncbi:Isoquinoline 1-oxidoreductase subunit beta [Serratia odorifera]|uniref:Isoquinoline 1-oxidoreductase subunit beta n=1 Tax=Serratia odorifera TaxID=618 RepID=A0A3S4DF47_SEROD|nr:molybdopterin cofactor-binding domain-containing protein [Serratia odorifera]VDZ53856.1 Isoquinoline 1-oxidoreductase subunit beta [Serratia odorifera]